LLTFPKLRPADFRPWIDERDAARKGNTPEEHARWTAGLWRRGLADWDQAPERIARFAEAAQPAVYTPGSQAGRPMSVLKSFAPPPRAVLEDGDALRERVSATTSGLLALLGIAADPIRSREHILLSTLFTRAWQQHQTLDLPTLIQQVQSPPVARVGVMELNTFYPATDRFGLAMSLNSLVAAPGFKAWTEGDPLEIGKLLYTAEGKPKVSIVSIAHLSDSERMFLVTSLLNEVVAWMRAQPGSHSLRALLYMDEVFGYLPPTANPPSKLPLLTLLKQARAFGLGVVLATQNPVDLDYKALSNAGTWFLGRLQTERDKARVLEGLEGASATAGAAFDRPAMERTLAGLRSRTFLMNNVHEDEPTVFHTRWALSYLAGPLTRGQIRSLAHGGAETTATVASGGAAPRLAAERPAAATAPRPLLAAAIEQRFAPALSAPDAGTRLVYRPSLRAQATLHFARSIVGVDEWKPIAIRAPLDTKVTDPWTQMQRSGESLPDFSDHPVSDASFAALPAAASQAKNYPRWSKSLKTRLYRSQTLNVFRCKSPKLVGTAGESEGEFRGRLATAVRQQRDLRIEKLRKRYAPKLKRVQERVERALVKVEKEQEQYEQQKSQTLISIGATVVGALFGRKLLGSRSVGRATTAARGFGRAARERGDIARAEERVEDLREELAELEKEFEADVDALRAEIDPTAFNVEEVAVRPRKADLAIDRILLVWEPWNVDDSGIAEPTFQQ